MESRRPAPVRLVALTPQRTPPRRCSIHLVNPPRLREGKRLEVSPRVVPGRSSPGAEGTPVPASARWGIAVPPATAGYSPLKQRPLLVEMKRKEVPR